MEPTETVQEGKIKAISPWFGAKRTLAQRIVQELGSHHAYWEPFCGSMAVLLAKPVCYHEHVNDLHGDLINLARVIRDPVDGAILYRRLRRTLFCESFHRESAQQLTRKKLTPVDRAYHYFVMSWMGRNGVSGTSRVKQTFARRYTPNGGQGGKRFASAVDSIPSFRRRLRLVNIEQQDAFELLSKIDDNPTVVVYCDPPYLVKGAKYEHDFTSADHDRLAALLARFKKTRVVCSYYDHPRLSELYSGWTKVHCHITKALVSQGMRDSKNTVKAPEVLLINGPSYTSNTLF